MPNGSTWVLFFLVLISIRTDLSKPANTIIRSNLLGTLESAIRSSNAQFDDQEFLDRLGIKLFEVFNSSVHLFTLQLE